MRRVPRIDHYKQFNRAMQAVPAKPNETAPRSVSRGLIKFKLEGGGIRIPLPILQTSTRDTSYELGEMEAAQYPAHVQAFLVDQRLKLVQETWDQLPEAIKAGITAMVQVVGD